MSRRLHNLPNWRNGKVNLYSWICDWGKRIFFREFLITQHEGWTSWLSLNFNFWKFCLKFATNWGCGDHFSRFGGPLHMLHMSITSLPIIGLSCSLWLRHKPSWFGSTHSIKKRFTESSFFAIIELSTPICISRCFWSFGKIFSLLNSTISSHESLPLRLWMREHILVQRWIFLNIPNSMI